MSPKLIAPSPSTFVLQFGWIGPSELSLDRGGCGDVGAASVVEVVVAAVLLGVAVVAMIRLAGSIYARTLLHRGGRLRWRDALRRTDALTG